MRSVSDPNEVVKILVEFLHVFLVYTSYYSNQCLHSFPNIDIPPPAYPSAIYVGMLSSYKDRTEVMLD